MNAEGCAQVRVTLLLGGPELWWPRWGSSRKTAPLGGTHVLHRLGPWAWTGCPGGLSVYGSTHLVVWEPPVTVCPP